MLVLVLINVFMFSTHHHELKLSRVKGIIYERVTKHINDSRRVTTFSNNSTRPKCNASWFDLTNGHDHAERTKVILCFPFHHELDILHLKLLTLSSSIQVFVESESAVDDRGHKKPKA